jgi:hypothetical protein
MKNYFKYTLFYGLTLLDSVINFLCSIIGKYPKLELGMSFIIACEVRRISVENADNLDKRQEKLQEASGLRQEAIKDG